MLGPLFLILGTLVESHIWNWRGPCSSYFYYAEKESYRTSNPSKTPDNMYEHVHTYRFLMENYTIEASYWTWSQSVHVLVHEKKKYSNWSHITCQTAKNTPDSRGSITRAVKYMTSLKQAEKSYRNRDIKLNGTSRWISIHTNTNGRNRIEPNQNVNEVLKKKHKHTQKPNPKQRKKSKVTQSSVVVSIL